MKTSTSLHRWVMPWLAPVALGVAYVVELVREGLAGEPLALLVQVLLAAPPVMALSVLLAIAEQELRAHALTHGPVRFRRVVAQLLSARNLVPSVVLLIMVLPLGVPALFALSWLFGERSSHAPDAVPRRLLNGS